MQKTQTNSSIVEMMFGDEVFADTWIIVTDSNDCDIRVTTNDLLSNIPPNSNPHEYVKVYYCGQVWWIHKSNYFPM